MLSLLAAADAYVVFVPNEALLIPAVLSHPKKWFRITFWMSVGSAMGAASFAELAGLYGGPFIERFDPHLFHTRGWHETARIINDIGGTWGLTVVSFSPLPQHAAVALVGLAHMSWPSVFIAVLVGRLAKYSLVAWCSVHAPGVLRKLGLFPKALEGGGNGRAPAAT